MEWIQHEEWMTWRSMCYEFEQLTGIDVNDPRCKPVMNAIKSWGEHLARLRDDCCTAKVRAECLQDARERYIRRDDATLEADRKRRESGKVK